MRKPIGLQMVSHIRQVDLASIYMKITHWTRQLEEWTWNVYENEAVWWKEDYTFD